MITPRIHIDHLYFLSPNLTLDGHQTVHQNSPLIIRHAQIQGHLSHLLHLLLHKRGELHDVLHHLLVGKRRSVGLQILHEAGRKTAPVAFILPSHPHQRVFSPLRVGVANQDHGLAQSRLGLGGRVAEGLHGIAQKFGLAAHQFVLFSHAGPGGLYGHARQRQHFPLAFRPVRHDGTGHDHQRPQPLLDDLRVHGHVADVTPVQIFVLGVDHIVPSHLQPLPKLHGPVGLPRVLHQTGDLVLQGPIGEIVQVSPSQVFEVGGGVFDPGRLVGQRDDGGVGGVPAEVGIVQTVPGIGTGEAGGIGPEGVDAVQQREKVAFGFGHFFGVHQHMSVGVISLGPEFRIVRPHRGVVEEGHGQMVGDEVLGGTA
mmetsp:Transcript_5384/g.11108  ORF Transcript_5384/g.11108 Transcript_5384/m.11108 type:complete len:369 (-) Transcript_5384:2210-3316(-)